jgi:uncharacterized protein YmfQ (DUF2313 family)
MAVRFTREQFREQILKLIPRGMAWPREKFTLIYAWAYGIANEFFRVDGRAKDLLEEGDPRTTTELLEEWEAVVGIPDECQPVALTLERRRGDVLARLTARGGIDKQFYIDYAASLGFDITIYEYRPFRAGISRAGDPVNDMTWNHAFRVNAPIETIKYFSAGISQAGDPLASWGNAFLECSLNKRKPLGKFAIYAYGA